MTIKHTTKQDQQPWKQPKYEKRPWNSLTPQKKKKNRLQHLHEVLSSYSEFTVETVSLLHVNTFDAPSRNKSVLFLEKKAISRFPTASVSAAPGAIDAHVSSWRFNLECRDFLTLIGGLQVCGFWRLTLRGGDFDKLSVSASDPPSSPLWDQKSWLL